MGVVLVLFALAPSPAPAAVVHAFDPTLSLTGDCATSPVDEVPDPGCPEEHAPSSFRHPSAVAVDSHGDIYVASFGNSSEGTDGKIDVFDPQGHFLLELANEHGPVQLALDGEGNFYVLERYVNSNRDSAVVLYKPDSYPPTAASEYEGPTAVVSLAGPNVPKASLTSIAVDPENGHLYVGYSNYIEEFSAASEGSEFLREIGKGTIKYSKSVAIGPGHDIYTASSETIDTEPYVAVLDGEDGHLKATIDGHETPNGAFLSPATFLAVAVDRENGHVYALETDRHGVAFEFAPAGVGEYEYVGPPISHSFKSPTRIVVDNSGGPNEGYLFVTSEESNHLYAFAPLEQNAPQVSGSAVSGIGRQEARLEADVNPNGLASEYRFEYVEESQYEADVAAEGPGHGFDHATRVPSPDGSLGSGSTTVHLVQPIRGLSPGTVYRWRVLAHNSLGTGKGKEQRFATYPAALAPSACPNEALRRGASAQLPDCRAYELVTPPDTNGHVPTAAALGALGGGFETRLAAPSGESLVFMVRGGLLPGAEGAGGINDDGYRALRGPAGWQTVSAGPSGAQSQGPAAGGVSEDGGYWFWQTGTIDSGSLAIPREGDDETTYIRTPQGAFELVGLGSLGSDPVARGRWISAGASHVIFESLVQLESNAPPSGRKALYDRSPGGPTHVVSLLPGEETPAAAASYLGASNDGSAVAFEVGGTLYVRRNDTETLEVATGEARFAGLSADGQRIFFLLPNSEEPLLEGTSIPQGDLFACDLEAGPCGGPGSQAPTAIGSGGESVPVNVSAADGSHLYFVSPKQLDGAKGVAGKDNLYLWDKAGVRFIATLERLDITGRQLSLGAFFGGLGLWTRAIDGRNAIGQQLGLLVDPSRTTPDGSVFLFESHADLTGYASEGHAEIYRYDANDSSLLCISCNPTLLPAFADARLEIHLSEAASPLDSIAHLDNVGADGKEVFFQSKEALVPADINEAFDVYEWQAQGTDGCARQAGCLRLISSGRGQSASYLYAMTPDGHDVFFLTTDTLLPQDEDSIPSIYDARVGGGFAQAEEGPQPCANVDTCRADMAPPDLDTAASAATQVAKPCPASARKVRRKGRLHCACPASARKVRRKGRLHCACPASARKVRRKGRLHCVKRRHHRHGGRHQGRHQKGGAGRR